MKHSEILKKMRITARDLDLIVIWSSFADKNDAIGFDWEGQWIVDIFTDTTRRFNKTLEEAVEFYGFENVNNFCHQVLDKARELCFTTLNKTDDHTEITRWDAGTEEIVIDQYGPDDFSAYYVDGDSSVSGSLLDVMKEISKDFGIENLKEKKND